MLLLLSFKNLGIVSLPTVRNLRAFFFTGPIRAAPLPAPQGVVVRAVVIAAAVEPVWPPENSLIFFDTCSVEGSNSVPESSEISFLLRLVLVLLLSCWWWWFRLASVGEMVWVANWAAGITLRPRGALAAGFSFSFMRLSSCWNMLARARTLLDRRKPPDESSRSSCCWTPTVAVYISRSLRSLELVLLELPCRRFRLQVVEDGLRRTRRWPPVSSMICRWSSGSSTSSSWLRSFKTTSSSMVFREGDFSLSLVLTDEDRP
uniref:(northern house mosquito) hypothetical protein n=1 Tax=Culex pipiens TaxID=7175 RepID=A0A8D8BGU9_CULPI